jgi:prevent-host-death family protein
MALVGTAHLYRGHDSFSLMHGRRKLPSRFPLCAAESNLSRRTERRELSHGRHRCRVPESGAVDLSSTQASGATILVARERAMAERVSTIDVRQRIGDLLNRVALRRDEFVIERKGKPLAALVPIERLEQMRRFARRHARGPREAEAELGHGGAGTRDRAWSAALGP